MEKWFAHSLILYISIHTLQKIPHVGESACRKLLRSSSGGAQVRINAQVLGTRGYGGMDVSWYVLGILRSKKTVSMGFDKKSMGFNNFLWILERGKGWNQPFHTKFWGIQLTESRMQMCHGWSKIGCTPKLPNDVEYQRTESFHPKACRIRLSECPNVK